MQQGSVFGSHSQRSSSLSCRIGNTITTHSESFMCFKSHCILVRDPFQGIIPYRDRERQLLNRSF